MNKYLIIVWDTSQDPMRVVYSFVLEDATAADAKAAAATWTDRRPNYAAGTIKITE